jgi:hypothetical protein
MHDRFGKGIVARFGAICFRSHYFFSPHLGQSSNFDGSHNTIRIVAISERKILGIKASTSHNFSFCDKE